MFHIQGPNTFLDSVQKDIKISSNPSIFTRLFKICEIFSILLSSELMIWPPFLSLGLDAPEAAEYARLVDLKKLYHIM